MQGKIGINVAGLGDKMSINLNLVVKKYACSEGWERPEFPCSGFDSMLEGCVGPVLGKLCSKTNSVGQS